MSELYFVRHGQAAFGTDDYDRLTDLGIQQSQWIGEYFAERGVRFDRILTGALVRHRETLQAMNGSLRFRGDAETDPGLNEFAHEALRDAHVGSSPEASRSEEDTPQSFYRRLEVALHAWAAGTIEAGVGETWQDFTRRVTTALLGACAGRGRRVLIVSSGGPMAVALGTVLGLSDAQIIALSMQVKNTAFSHFYFDEQRVQLASFNNIPHLDRAERRHAITLT
ncbi:MAG: histidine phosphatase family protein [Deltaproteobacteria bacterium]|nr:histidine phosphatase family protein [Deltaproteobacteria bacterium]